MKTTQEFYLQTLLDLIEIYSPSQHEMQAAQYVAQTLRGMGYEPQIQEVGEDSANVLAWIPGGDGPVYLLGGHLDTVPIAENWKHSPLTLTREGNRLYGLGASDMKGGIAAWLTVLWKFACRGERPAGRLLFAALADEEGCSRGANRFAQDPIRVDYAILAEPHYREFVVGAAGKALLELIIQGMGGHAARPESGVSAIEAAVRFLAKADPLLRSFYLEGKTGSHCALRIWSEYEGYCLNIPECCHILLNKQLLPEENVQQFIAQLHTLFHESCPNAELRIEQRIPYYPSYVSDTSNPHFLRLKELVCRQLGHNLPSKINQSVSDGNILERQMGIPTVVFGPDGIGFHKPDEYLLLDSVLSYVDCMYRFFQKHD